MPDDARQPVKCFTQPSGIEEYHVVGVDGWEDFEAIVEFIVRRFSAEIMDRLDGICSRTWILRSGDVDFVVKHHDDIGNYFFSAESSPEKEKLLRAVAAALNAQLSSAKDRSKSTPQETTPDGSEGCGAQEINPGGSEGSTAAGCGDSGGEDK